MARLQERAGAPEITRCVPITVTYTVSLNCVACMNSSTLSSEPQPSANDSNIQTTSGSVGTPVIRITTILETVSISGTPSPSTSAEATTSSSSHTTAVIATPTCLPTVPPLACYRFRKDFPSIDRWISWNCLVSLNKATLLAQNGPDEAEAVIAGIEAVSKKAGIDP